MWNTTWYCIVGFLYNSFMVFLLWVFIWCHQHVATNSPSSLHYVVFLHKFLFVFLLFINLHSILFSLSIESSSSTNNGHAPLNHNNEVSSNPNKCYQNDTLNPYFMHPNKNSILVLVKSLLKLTIIILCLVPWQWF